MRFRDPNSHATFVVETYWRPIKFVDGVAEIDENSPYADTAIEFLTRFGYVCVDDPAVSDAVAPYLGVVDPMETNTTGGRIQPEDSYYNDKNRPTFVIPPEGALSNTEDAVDAPVVEDTPLDEAPDESENENPTDAPEAPAGHSHAQPQEKDEEEDMKDSVPAETAAAFYAAHDAAEKKESVRDRAPDAEGFGSEEEENQRVEDFVFALSGQNEPNPIRDAEAEEQESVLVSDGAGSDAPEMGEGGGLEAVEDDRVEPPTTLSHPDSGGGPLREREDDVLRDVPNPDSGTTAEAPKRRSSRRK